MRHNIYFLVIPTVWALPLQQNKTETAEYERLQYSSSQSQHNPDYQELRAGVQHHEISDTRHQRSEDLDQERTGRGREYGDLLSAQSRLAHLNLGANLGPVGKLGLSAGLGPGMTGLGLGAQLGQLGGGAAVGLTSSGFYLLAAAGQRDNYLEFTEYQKYNDYHSSSKSQLLRTSPPLPTPPSTLCCLLYGRGQPTQYLYSDFPIRLRA